MPKHPSPCLEPRSQIMLIPELCLLMGLTEQQRQNFSVMKDVAQHTRHVPADRQKKMLDFFK